MGAQIAKAIQRVSRLNSPATIEYKLRVRKRTEHYKGRFLPHAEHQIIATIRNITERKLAEKRLRQSLREKEILLREIHHRVKNNLLLVSSPLSLQVQQHDQNECRHIFLECQRRIKSMAMIHEELDKSHDLALVDIRSYILNLIAHLQQLYHSGTRQICWDVNIARMRFSIELAIPIALIVNELIANALKHAFPGRSKGTIRIALSRRRGGSTLLVVSDDGIGPPKHVEQGSSRPLGMRLVRLLVEQIDGEIECTSDAGSEFRICQNS